MIAPNPAATAATAYIVGMSRRMQRLALVFALAGCADDPVPNEPVPPEGEQQGTGDLVLEVSTTGGLPDPDGYSVRLGTESRSVSINEAVRFDSLLAGSYTAEIDGLAPNCRVDGDNPRATSIEPGAIHALHFRVVCPYALRNRLVYWDLRPEGWYLVRSNPDGTGQEDLLGGEFYVADPAVSPDGTKIAVRATRAGHFAIHLVDGDGTNLVDVSRASSGSDGDPAWSPDGRWLAFASNRDGGGDSDAYDIYVLNVEPALFGRPVDKTELELIRLTTHPARDDHPTWSPDGTRIAFRSQRDGDSEIYAIGLDGTDLTNITNDPAMLDAQPAWSPDGARIALTRQPDSGVGSIWVIGEDGSGAVRITDASTDDGDPAWSPDGTRIAFMSYRDGSADVFVMNADGSNPVNLTPTSGVETVEDYSIDLGPSWSPP